MMKSFPQVASAAVAVLAAATNAALAQASIPSFQPESIPLDVRANDVYEDIELGRLEQGVIDTVNRTRG